MQIETFKNPEIGEIRGIIKNGEPWFFAGQVCRCLGIKNSRDAVKTIRDRYKIAEIEGVGDSYTLIDTAKGKQKVNIIPEAFLYELIFQSRKQKAIKFRAWVTNQVLPQLRKKGFYRAEGIITRKSLTDSIKDSGENEKMHGHAYSNYTRLIYKSLGLSYKNDRDNLNLQQVDKIAHKEALVKSLINEGYEYKEIKEIILKKELLKVEK